jgi:hypothetical protein
MSTQIVNQISTQFCENTLLVLGVHVGKSQQCGEHNWNTHVHEVKQL